MWIYSQGFETLYYQASVDGPLTEVAKGYSGRGVGRNDPTYQCNEEWGPLPIGKYTIEEPKKGPTPYSLPLEPDPTNDMCDPPRENFLIHGDKATEPPEINLRGVAWLHNSTQTNPSENLGERRSRVT